MATNLVVIFFCYLIGSIPTSIIFGKLLRGIDIREHGSGNAGATNVYRVMGLKIALIVLAIDALKGALAVMLAGRLIETESGVAAIIGGLAAIIGHVFTVFAKFKGGKGIGPALGVFLALLPFQAAVAFGSWIVIFVITKTVSKASIVAGLVLFSASIAGYKINPEKCSFEALLFTGVVALLILITHRKNIVRILAGTESKISFGKQRE